METSSVCESYLEIPWWQLTCMHQPELGTFVEFGELGISSKWFMLSWILISVSTGVNRQFNWVAFLWYLMSCLWYPCQLLVLPRMLNKRDTVLGPIQHSSHLPILTIPFYLPNWVSYYRWSNFLPTWSLFIVKCSRWTKLHFVSTWNIESATRTLVHKYMNIPYSVQSISLSTLCPLTSTM